MATMIEYRRMLAERDLASVWPQWKIVRLLGTGAFGEVYEIRREEYGRIYKCALKIIRQDNAAPLPGDYYNNISRGSQHENYIQTVLREIDIMEKLKGAPNIVVIEDYTVVNNADSSAVLIRMELLTNLGEFMTSRQVTINDVLRIGTDICTALEYCESLNIIHRDVKESNIFYSEMGYFKLGDFGISRQLNDYLMNSGTLTSAGTVSKMAPEVYNGKPYDNRVDIYSLGIVLYCLLNYGRPPFYPPYPQNVTAEDAYRGDMMRIRGEAIPPLSGVDAELSRIICKACNSKPSARYQTASEFKDALTDYYNEINGISSGFRKRNRSGGRGNRTLLTAVLAACCVVVAGSVAFWLSSGSKGKKDTTPDVAQIQISETENIAEAESIQELQQEPQEPKAEPSGEAQMQNMAGTFDPDEEEDDAEDGFSEDGFSEDGSPEESDEEETGGYSPDAGSARHLNDQGGGFGEDSWGMSDSDSIVLSDDSNNTIARITVPSWADGQSQYSESVYFSGKRHGTLADFSIYYTESEGSSFISWERDYILENENYESIELTDITRTTIGGKSVEYFKAIYKYRMDGGDDGLYYCKYHAAIEVDGGALIIEDSLFDDIDAPVDLSFDEFKDDISCIRVKN